MLKVAIAREANHYRRAFDPTLPADLPAISDEEIGVALCLGQNIHVVQADALEELNHARQSLEQRLRAYLKRVQG